VDVNQTVLVSSSYAVAINVSAPALLPRDGGSDITFNLMQPAWTAGECTAIGAPTPNLVSHFGSTNPPTVCTIKDDGSITCSTPPGSGINLESWVSMCGLANFSLPHFTFSAPVVSETNPSYIVAHSPLPIVVDVGFRSPADLAYITDLRINGAACSSAIVRNATISCEGWNANDIIIGNGTDSTTLIISFAWVDTRVSQVISSSWFVFRPTLTSVTPTAVAAGGVLVLFGGNFCPPAGCDASVLSQLSVQIGTYTCLGVSPLSASVATCTLPVIPYTAAGYPVFIVMVLNAFGTPAVLQPAILYPVGGYVSAAAPLPVTFLPSDAGDPWPMTNDIVVSVMPSLMRLHTLETSVARLLPLRQACC
jgi:hypothetical protein